MNERGMFVKDKLAVFGGFPVRNDKIFYGKQTISEEDIQAVSDVLRGPFITQGPFVDQFEQDLCDYTGAKYAVCASNGTAALHIACLAAGITQGDEVITTPITFAASANCVLYCGATPVFADINPKTYNIDPESIEKYVTPKTKAIIAVDFTGQPVEIQKIRDICDKHGLIFIQDAAHSIGSAYNGVKIGNHADMTTFSFHPVKTITGGEGGAVLTNNSNFFEKLALFRTHGITKMSKFMKNKNEGPWYYEQIELGYNYRLTDFQAALLSSQLKRLDEFKEKRTAIVEKYNKAFSIIPELFIQEEIKGTDSCKHLYILNLHLEKLACTRLEFFNALSAENIQPQVHYIPVYYMPYYEELGYKKGICPNAEHYYERVLSLPLYPSLTEQDTDDVISAVKKVINYYKDE